jgi:hypothetical protein
MVPRAARAPEPRRAATVPAASAPPARSDPRPVDAAAPEPLEVSFPLDPRLTRGLHLGDRWVAPRTYSRSGAGETLVFAARARRLDAPAEGDEISWTSASPDVVSVSSPRGAEIALTVHGPGRTTVTVSEGDASRALALTAVRESGVLRVLVEQ